MFIQANKSDDWDSDTFKLTVLENGKLVDREFTDDDGPIMDWLNAIEAHNTLSLELPVNL